MIRLKWPRLFNGKTEAQIHEEGLLAKTCEALTDQRLAEALAP